MKVLSLLQPWATLVVAGIKTIETRSWTSTYRGRLLIHASAGKGGSGVASHPEIAAHIPSFKALPFGSIIGEVTLDEIVCIGDIHITAAALQEATLELNAFGPDSAGRYAWMLLDALLYEEPIPAKGKLGLWEW